MPSTSKKQQGFFRMVHAVQKGAELNVSHKLLKRLKKTANSMSEENVNDYLKNRK